MLKEWPWYIGYFCSIFPRFFRGVSGSMSSWGDCHSRHSGDARIDLFESDRNQGKSRKQKTNNILLYHHQGAHARMDGNTIWHGAKYKPIDAWRTCLILVCVFETPEDRTHIFLFGVLMRWVWPLLVVLAIVLLFPKTCRQHTQPFLWTLVLLLSHPKHWAKARKTEGCKRVKVAVTFRIQGLVRCWKKISTVRDEKD